MSDRQDLEAQIRSNLDEAGLTAAEIRVMPDAYSGWRIAVVSADFEGMSGEARRQAALAALLDQIKIQWLDLLTPEELEWAGSLPANIEPEALPLWPESLARAGRDGERAVFPSSLEEDLPAPIVATFYSLRGGVGRSTALAYTAWVLADHGKKVVCADLDLEAPGLAALFDKESELREDQGIVDLLISIDQGNTPDVSEHLIRVSEKHELYCLPAGIPDADYARKLSSIDPEAWYREERNPLRELLTLIADMPLKPDVVLLDSRTGITRLSGPLLFDLADLAFIVFFPHPQARKGTEGLVRALLASHTRRSTPERPLAPEPRFVVSPIPSPGLPQVVEHYQHRAIEWIADWLAPSDLPRSHEGNESEITHFIPYQEELATSDMISTDRTRWRAYEPLAEWIERFLPTVAEQQATPKVADRKDKVLAELAFPTGTAEDQAHLSDTFVETNTMNRALQPDVPLVIGRKGTGKTAVFRFLQDSRRIPSTVVLAPAAMRAGMEWQLSPDGFQEAEKILHRLGKNWRDLWTAYTCLACQLQPWAGGHRLMHGPLLAPPQNELQTLEVLQGLLGAPNASILLRQWLQQLDSSSATRLLLFDGLDSGFGSSRADRERRTHAVSGLMSMIVDVGETLKRLRFKILLRMDIWRRLRFENKSHLFGRSVQLAWDSQPDYLTVALRQALRAPSFRELLDESDIKQIEGQTTRNEDAVYRVWNTLVGERMKGGRAAYTSNWVWSRLADANGDHSPRTLLQMFALATEQERTAHRHTPYEASVLRPRTLMDSLDQVSTNAVDALIEEFSELEPLQRRLNELGRTPVLAPEVEALAEEVALAREVGLLSVYEGTDSEPIRYRVPDLYRLGLSMTRRGQF